MSGVVWIEPTVPLTGLVTTAAVVTALESNRLKNTLSDFVRIKRAQLQPVAIMRCIHTWGGRMCSWWCTKSLIKQKRKYNYNGVEDKHTTMSSVYITASIYHRQPAKGFQINNRQQGI